MANDRLTTADAAKLAGVATSTIKRWADQGLIRLPEPPGGHRRYTRAVVERMLRRVSETTDPMVDDWLACLIRLDRYELESRLMGARGRAWFMGRVADQLSKVLIELNRRWHPLSAQRFGKVYGAGSIGSPMVCPACGTEGLHPGGRRS